MRTLTLVFCIAITFAACQNSADMNGPAPAFSSSVEVLFEKYKKKTNPELFIISTDGQRAVFTYCPDIADLCPPSAGATKAKALKKCEERSGGVPCKVYAVGRRVVWKGRPASDRASGFTSASDYEICNYAITMEGGTASWESREAWIYYVAEAKRRDLTLERCTDLTSKK